MAHIDLGLDERQYPGIIGLLRYRPETAAPLLAMVEVLMRGPHPLSEGERELIATYVSGLNECRFCRTAHAALAAARLDEGATLVEQVLTDPDTAPIPAKLRSLLRIAAAVQRSGREVTAELVADARAAGASDLEIHDTVLISAVFCMANRYVDGLGTLPVDDPAQIFTTAGQTGPS
ncbi:peroxidase-related enzyme [Micromonospora echinofusca]|uniref:Peroxidase-related enzyme n=1 Tax=Micromonospora echinofusca TaxID=47858 RepID=A0ABS3VSE1_MICEH|nr:peroxidase-related enzyme [Micromonospora echinofusca]